MSNDFTTKKINFGSGSATIVSASHPKGISFVFIGSDIDVTRIGIESSSMYPLAALPVLVQREMESVRSLLVHRPM